MAIQIIPASSLEKVFLDQRPAGTYTGGSLLENENYSFQFAFTGTSEEAVSWGTWAFADILIESDIADHLELYSVGHVGVALPTYPRYDQDYLRTEPGMYPDPLAPVVGNQVKILSGKWQSVWVRTTGTLPAGDHTVRITLSSGKFACSASAEVTLHVIPARLPEQQLIYTCWLHADCIADLHGCEPFSETHWSMMEQYMKWAGECGMNMVLVPAFTPALDTPVGGERMTIQLVGVRKQGNQYEFDFTRLDRYLRIAMKHGIRWFEHSHFFTQWGAGHAPKVVADVNGSETRIFGWETQADGEEYTEFLHQYLDALIPHLKGMNLDNQFYYHISDEPNAKHLDSYRRAKAVVESRLQDYHMFDALSHVEFYRDGLVRTPVVSTDSIEPFLGEAEDLWAYYTGGQSFLLSNRLISLSSRRNRVLGMQLYKYHIHGFLQWAFNFYYNTLSREAVNPYISPDALGEFPAGTAYQVYPHADGPRPALRLFVFHDALQDVRAMQLLETAIGHDAVVALVEEYAGPVTFTSCPPNDEQFLRVREAVNRAIEEQFAH